MPLVTINGVQVYLPDGYTYGTSPGSVATPALNVPGQAQQPAPIPSPPGTTPAPVPQPYTGPLTPSQQAWQNSKQILEGKRKQLLQNYGLTEKGQLDPNNRFGQARQLLGRYGQQLELARMENAGRGIGKHGIAQQRSSLVRNLMGAASYALTQNFLGQLAGIDMDIGKLGVRPLV